MFRLNAVCLVALLVLVLVMLTSTVTCQIHFSPTWGTGKRSEGPSMPQASSDTCWAQSDLRIVFQLAQVIKREAQRYNQCMGGFSNMEEFKDE
nr:hypothetical protein BaRGS_008075 [Batillaria attramentaria]